MHIKIINPRGWDFESTTTELVKVASSGELRGNDRSTFIKRASGSENIFLPFLDRIKVAKDEPLVHLLALGSSEIWGCFIAGTPIAMADGRYQAVETLQIGDAVLSADGHSCPVSHLFKRTVPQTIRVSVCGLADDLVCSKEHPFRVLRKEQVTCQHDKYKRCLPPTFGEQNICQRTIKERACVTSGYRNLAWEWADASSLREGDFLIWTVPDLPAPIELSVDEGYLLGAWLAEGNFIRNSGNKAVASIELNIHAGEADFLSRLERCASGLGLTLNSYVYAPDLNSRSVRITGNPSRFRVWHTLFNEHAKDKLIPPWVCCLSRPVRLAIVAGYLDGDGSCQISDKENRTTACSAGEALSLGFQRLCWSLGFPAVRCKRSIDGYGQVALANSYLQELIPYSYKIRGRDLKQTTKIHGFFHEGRMYLPIRNISETDAAEVFNFEVEGDHTYSGPNVDSHNCNRNGDAFTKEANRKYHKTFEKHAKFFRNHKNKDKDPSFGIVKCAVYNDKMQRVELLVGLNGTKEAAERNKGFLADKEMEKLARGEDIGVSMACKVPQDRCSWCGNLAKTRAEYCKAAACEAGGCSDNLTKLVKVAGDIHQLGVYNDEPTFFDISNVFRPADPTAYGWRADWYEKSASDISYFEIGSSKTANDLGLVVPARLYREMDAHTGNPYHDELLKLASLLQEFEDYGTPLVDDFGLAFNGEIQNTFKLADFLSETEQGNLHKVASVLNALTQEKIILPLKEFATITGREELAKHASLENVYSRLFDSGNVEAIVQNSVWTQPTQPLKAFNKQARALAPYYSLDAEHVHNRVCLASLRGHQNPISKNVFGNIKTANAQPEVENLCRDYAMYKLASLYQISDYDNEFVLTIALSQCQNRAS